MNRRADRAKIICAGRVYGDLIFGGINGPIAPGQETYCDSLAFHPGGGAFITAAHLAALGRQVDLLATIPAAPFGDPLMQAIAHHHIGTGMCRPAPAGTDPQITVAMVQGGERAFLTRRDGPGLPADHTHLFDTGQATHLHIGELATLADYPDLLALAQSKGMTVSLDCGWDPSVFDQKFAPLIAGVDIFLPNQAEADALADAGLTAPLSKLDVVKQGAKGARALWQDGAVHAVAQCATVVDPTGAGDAFNAGFIDAWLARNPVEACLQSGNSAGARAVACVGGAGGIDAQV